MAKGWIDTADPELAALRDAPGSRKEKRERLAEYLRNRPVVVQDVDPSEDGTDGTD